MEINYSVVGKRIKENRELRKLSQEKLAELTNLSTNHIARLEGGTRKPSLDTLAVIAQELNVNIDTLLVGNQEPRDSDYSQDVLYLLSDCTSFEKRVIMDVAKSVKKSLIENRQLLNIN